MNSRTKGGEFLIKETSCQEVFSPEDFDEAQRMMAQAAREFIDREVWPQKDRFEKKDYALTEEIMKKLGTMGMLGIGTPQEYGGSGMDFVSDVLVCDLLSGATGALGTAFGAHTGIGTLPIALYGAEKQKQEYLPKLATGEWFGAYCLTEPEAGSDANSGKTKAVLTQDGKHYKITGQKMWISNAGFARLWTVFARIETDKNITAFIIEYDPNNGITLGEEENKLGIRSSSTRQVFFNETLVPVENMLGQRNGGFKIAVNVLNAGRIKLAAACLDAQRRVITQAIKHSNERKQFGRRISDFGAIQHKLAEMATRCYAGESACYRAAHDIEKAIETYRDQGSSGPEAKLKGLEEYAVEAALLKVFCSESLQYISDEGLQIYGGMGFSEDTPMEAAWRDARITRIYEGTNEINRLLIVGMLLRKAQKGELDLIAPAKAVANELISVPSFETPERTGRFDEEKALIKNLKKLVLLIAGKAVQNFGAELENHQQLLLKLADIIIGIYLSESTLLRTEKHLRSATEEESQKHIAMTQLQLYQAVEKAEHGGREAILCLSTGDERRMLLMGLRRFTKYTDFPNVIQLRELAAQKLIENNQYKYSF